jgi:hypothetical protein
LEHIVSMLRNVIAIVVSGALAGCRDPSLDELKAVKVEVCACKDVECADAAKKKTPQRVAVTPAHSRIAQEMLECYARIAAREVAAPDEGGSGSASGSGAGSN